MAVRRTRRSAATLDTLLIRVRRAVGDIVDDAAPAAGDRKWENTAIVDAINDMLSEMYVELYGQNPDAALLELALAYTADAEEVELPSNEATSYAIYGVFEDVNGKPTLLRHVDRLVLDRYNTEGSEPTTDTERVWSIRDEYISLRPIPSSALTLTILYVAPPFGMDSGTLADQHPMPVQHEELLVLGAANRLQYPNDQLPVGRQAHYNRLWMKWQQDCDRYQGPRFPADTRRWR
jgi:hypothetical protein